MEKRLFHLFGYQRVAQNKALQELILKTAAEGGSSKAKNIELPDELMGLAAAAGVPAGELDRSEKKESAGPD